MPNLAIIPARGGSRRIPRKNIRPLGARPVISYVIETAKQCDYINEVMVSTDDAEIAEVAKTYGANVPFLRSADASGDHATLAEVLLEVISSYAKEGRTFEHVCCLLPTAALIRKERVQEGYRKLIEGGYDSLVSVMRYGSPVQRALKASNGLLSLREPEHIHTRTQDLEPHYFDAAQFYWIRSEALVSQKKIFTARTGFLELTETEAQDVDNEADWDMLSLKFKNIK